MRPIKLTFEGFGPYVNKTVIEFDKIGVNGLFLITGATGAGKTTIFDAIKFALYGEASGDARGVSMLRSTLANPETPTFVELEFEYQGKKYTIKRTPSYMRKAKRGDGVTEAKSEVLLTLPDGSAISKSTSVDAKILEILKISADQFSQITMLAQGEFRELLFSSTKEKLEIMRKLFNTEKFNALQDELKKEIRRLSDLTDSILKINRAQLKVFVFPDDVENIDECKSVVDGGVNDDVALAIVKKILEADNKSAEEIQKQLDEIWNQITTVNETLSKITQREKDEATEKVLTAQRQEAEGKSKALDAALNEAKSHADEVQKLSDEVAVITSQRGVYEELKKREDALHQKETMLGKNKRKEELLKGEISKSDVKIQKDKDELSKLGDAPAKLAKKEAELSQLNEQLKKVNKIGFDIAECEKAVADLRTAQNALKDLNEKLEKAKRVYDESYGVFIEEQAGLIAGSLKEGMPCPVCGSTSHPHLAVKSEGAPTKEELEQLKNEKERKEKEVNEASQKCSGLKSVAETKESDLIDAIKGLLGDGISLVDAKSKCEVERKNLKDSISQCSEEIVALKKDSERKEALEKSVPVDEKSLNEKRDEQQNLTNSISADEATVKSEKDSIEKDTKGLSYPSLEAANAAIKERNDKVKSLQDAITQADKAVKANAAAVSNIEGQLNQIKKSLEGAIKESREVNEKKLVELKGQQNILEQSKNAISRRIGANEGIVQTVEDNIEQNKATLAERQWKADLFQGIVSEKMTLETYVQTKFFEKILAVANVKFMKMTNNRYEMRRSENESGGGFHGLEIDVIDHFNGTRRHIKSVSGGESFMASLSLALGMSEYIQMQAGGIKLDAMFVDEGFGSLDSDTLNRAIETLTHLSDNGLLIGLISHVDALEKRIDKRIVVEKDLDGSSTAKLIV